MASQTSTGRFGAALTALAIAVTIAVVAAAPVAGGSAPPPCRYADVLTEHRAYSDWNRTLLDTEYMVGSGYAPPGLVSTTQAGLNGGYYVRQTILADLRAMASAARAAGAPLGVISGYRSYQTQRVVFANAVEDVGYQEALKRSARPGHSEHQLGTTLDFKTPGASRAPWEYEDWGNTPQGRWLRNNGWRYGFLMSYPQGKRSVTCYIYEPWHYRYFGREKARLIRQSGLTPREYLWQSSATGEGTPGRPPRELPPVPPPTEGAAGQDGPFVGE